MSSKATGEAQPEAVADVDPSLPTDIADDTDDADTETAPDTAASAVPDEPGGSTELAGAAEPGEPAEFDETAEFDEPAGPIEMSESADFAESVEDAGPTRHGRGLLLAAGFLLAAFAIVGGAVVVVGSLTHGFKKPVKITYKKSAIFGLRTGDCVDLNGRSAVIVGCGTAHEAEVFATFTLPASAWPGNATVRSAASSGCASRLTGYLNPQLAISLSSMYVYPDSVAWRAGTRTVICEVRAASGQLTGSVRGATATATAG